jgi:DNA-binding HxlR family transcriptional regulator
MDYLAKKWMVMILLELYKGNEWKRFSEIMAGMKEITPKVLSDRLKELEKEGLVENRVIATSFPVRSEYRLTPSAVELMDVIHDLKLWALRWKVDNEACKGQMCNICTL